MTTPSTDLFTYADRYPQVPGWKSRETSRQAAERIDASTLRAKVLECIKAHGPCTADEAAAHLRIDRLSVRPRCSELARLGKLHDSGERRLNASGKRAIAWQAL